MAIPVAPIVKLPPLPLIAKAPAPLLKVTDVTENGPSMTGVRRVVPANAIASPVGFGAVPPQFRPVVQKSFAPPPFQVLVPVGVTGMNRMASA